jgi:putative endonuclease
VKRGGAVYIMTNENHTTLYTGITSELKKRVYEHKNKIHANSFTAKYQLYKLVYYEGFHSIEEAISREKKIKGGSRMNKIDIINAFNPEWKDLYEEVMQW